MNGVLNEVLTRMIQEARETKEVLSAAAVFIRGVPNLLRQAVADALAGNKNLTDADVAEISRLADELDAGQAQIVAAIAEGTPAALVATPPAGLSIQEQEALKRVPPFSPPAEPVESAPFGPPAPVVEPPPAEPESRRERAAREKAQNRSEL